MEKFSAYRDPGTGIQPFLPPVPPLASELLTKVFSPLRYILGVIRTIVVVLLLLGYVVIVPGLCLVFTPVPPLHRVITRFFTAFTARATLLTLGLFWIPIEHVTRKRGRGPKRPESWDPQAGDIIVSNWVSWIEVLWLAFRFNPIFVLPVSETVSVLSAPSRSSTPVTHTPGRRTGTGSANIQSPSRTTAPRVPILGFRKASLLSIIRFTGYVPPFGSSIESSTPLEDIRKGADRPIVVFPECTTSNGRGLLHFANVFRETIPVKKYRVFIMCVRYDPPTVLTPTLSHPIPSLSFNPLPNIFTLATSLVPLTVSIRLLAPSESPGSQLFIASEVISGSADEDQLTESSAALIAQIGKMKRTGMSWEDKASFLEFYRGKRK